LETKGSTIVFIFALISEVSDLCWFYVWDFACFIICY